MLTQTNQSNQMTESTSKSSTRCDECSNDKSIRSISLADSIQFEFEGNSSKHSIVLGDCDNDGRNELVIGTLNSELLVFKDDCRKPYASSKDLGMIACVLIGDILNSGLNHIISLSIEGFLKILKLSNGNQSDPLGPLNEATLFRKSTASTTSSIPSMKLPPIIADSENNPHMSSSSTPVAVLSLVHQQQIQANAMSALLVDLDNDENKELVVALSDRVIRCYRAVQNGEEIKLIGLYKWEFSDQIGNISLMNKKTKIENDDRIVFERSILVTQFGGVFAKITCDNLKSDCLDVEEIEQTVVYHHQLQESVRNPQASCEILANIENRNDENLIALAIRDGLLLFFDAELQIKWKHYLEHPILTLQKCDINHDGNDELMVCTWSGLCYIIDIEGRMLTISFNQPISAFIVGQYYHRDAMRNCLAFTNFTSVLNLFFDIDGVSMTIETDVDHLQRQIRENHPELIESLMSFKKLMLKMQNSDSNSNSQHESDDEDDRSIKISSNLIRTLLYEIPQ
ncbi:hypothetical protein SSS_00207 [Sarcoptes scabiei]|nr:hypothetical protein SSS_00207 [Sarcoptes scabiei]